jgi:hypothetical protein
MAWIRSKRSCRFAKHNAYQPDQKQNSERFRLLTAVCVVRSPVSGRDVEDFQNLNLKKFYFRLHDRARRPPIKI